VTGRGLTLLATLSGSCGYHRIPTGNAGYFTLVFQADPDEACPA
jgi:hypothetical protein